MSNVPVCPVHGSPMRQGKGGSFFCPKKNGDDWCDQRVAAAKPAPAAAPASAPASGGSAPSTHALLLMAAMDMAGKVYQGTGDAGSALEFVSRAYASALAELEVPA